MLTIHEETGCLPGERQDLQDTKQQSQAEILPLLEKKSETYQHQILFFS